MPDVEDTSGSYELGLALAGAGEWFAAHEAFETAWRVAPPSERDFLQGLVHVVVWAYQANRGRPIGAERQRAKAQTRLAPYAPTHRDLNVAQLLEVVTANAVEDLARCFTATGRST
ncbi:unannotated protein [freshwater metagenome]|uniref:Unannotated protein n=1 Tax=freshwater metagenome TaxID=449393 RepID=A0A6J6PQV4_9ZZZZ